MMKRFVRQTLFIPLAAVAWFALATAPVMAQEPEATKQTVALSPKVGKKLQEIQLMVEGKQHAAAAQGLNEMLTWKNLESYERAQIFNLTAYNEYLQEDYQGAINAYEKVLREEIPPALRQSSLKTTAQLYFTVANYDMALRRVQELISIIDAPSADVLMLLGQAYFQADRFQEALGPIKEGIDLYRSQGKTPKENWLLLLRVCYYELQDYRGMVNTLNELLRYYPKDSYMLTLAGAYSELGDTKKQLVITEVLYEAGIIQGSQHAVNLANLYLMHDIPYRAAEVLEEAMGSNAVDSTERNLRLLSQSWYQAREDQKSIPPLERAAAISSEGELYVRLAQSQLNLDLWDDAIESINKGLNKGGVKRRDKAYVMMGMAHLNRKRLNDAESAFIKARDAGGSDKQVQQWLAFVANEKKREETMRQTLPDQVEREQDEILQNIPDSSGG
ncbi:MAG: tetratricopeptide repeat protein [Pseudomonadota bacterium]